MVRSLFGAGLAEETPVRVDEAGCAWRRPPWSRLGPSRPRGLRQRRLQQAAQGFLDAWDARAANDGDIADKLTGQIAALRFALAASASVAAAIDPSRPPKDTGQVQVLAMLRGNEGADGPQIAETLG